MSPANGLPVGFRFSQSSLQDYADCPRRFRLRYLERLDYPALETEPVLEYERLQREGTHFHRLVHQYLLGVPADKLRPLAQKGSLQTWWQNFEAFARTALGGLTLCLPEISLSVPLGQYRLLAKYDLLAVTEGDKALIYDWKTSLKRPKNEWLAGRWQTRVYRWLAVQAGAHFNANKPFAPEQVEMVYWMASAPDNPAHFPYSSAQFKRDSDVLQAIVTEIESAVEFPMTEDQTLCRFCTYRSYCDRGSIAGNLGDLEGDGGDTEELFDLNFEQISEIAF